MSGNYDYPPASSRRPSRGSNERPLPPSVLRLQHLRNLVNSERNRTSTYNTTRALETLNQEEHHLDRTRDRSNFEQARAAVDRQIQQFEFSNPAERIRNLWHDQLRSERSSPSSSSPTTQEMEPRSSGRGFRRRVRPEDRQRHRDPPDFASLLDEGVSQPRSPSLIPQSTHTSRDGRGRLKRRKLDADDNREGLRGFNYGQFGQVVPGALKMEIASCDGGMYDPDGDSSLPENVLRSDQSVYCTKSDRCNLVLRHRGEAPFCLKKIVIKAPRTGFDAPIQEGMVFVSMTSDELLARTAEYQIQYSNTRRRRRNRRSGMQPSQEYLTAYRSPLQSLERTVLMGPDSSASDPELPATGREANDPQAEFRVTTEYDENSEETGFLEPEANEDLTVLPLSEIERMNQADQSSDFMCSDSDESESDDDEEDGHSSNLSTFTRRRLELRRRIGSMRRQYSAEERELQRRRQGPSLIDPVPPPPPAPAPDAAHDSNFSSPEVLKPHARFFIEREKSMVSIKFDPPPSGRFILIKLWSPRSDGNIDIQSIIAHGFAGPRFFPAGGFR
ncbi:hypothetical protein N7474_008799 [Penicillium riverlandense]|uniref:uncharacterized protein n=1 Tax=Penicillium riverlandense TaxID=1903569 RepID=UPI00254730F6|nr:uncharacterized protein N7474_008799 [Penicillium riverlandense]KAJ5812498.1 hypothetical protein N7474_008799 [Penicillium riverlandense]